MRQAGWPIIQPARCEQNKKHLLSQMLFGTAEGIRTPDLLVRSQTLYPTELQPHFEVFVRLPDGLFSIAQEAGFDKPFFEKIQKIFAGRKMCVKLDFFVCQSEKMDFLLRERKSR